MEKIKKRLQDMGICINKNNLSTDRYSRNKTTSIEVKFYKIMQEG